MTESTPSYLMGFKGEFLLNEPLQTTYSVVKNSPLSKKKKKKKKMLAAANDEKMKNYL